MINERTFVFIITNIDWLSRNNRSPLSIGGTLFILRIILMLAGGLFSDGDVGSVLGSETDFSGDVVLDGDLDTGSVGDHIETDTSFRLLSFQGLSSFFLIFGLVGLTLSKANLHVLLTVFGAMVAGLFSVWVISILFSQTRRLQADGTINIKNAVGERGTVYLTIPGNGSGQVQVSVQGSLKIFDAISKEKKKIATGEKIQVVDVADGKTLVVKKVQ